ncbi:MAG: 23S rRNA (guanosine(2251)-2'-O)-methyltransferase RlmB [Defluviitaleaceae bacterium]|nr:23S rRNA (guanosine(2251)-2'-O)-methyltransferase RlmB [Defluviitaleaceae bacterium]
MKREFKRDFKKDQNGDENNTPLTIAGRNAVMEAIKAGKPIHRLYVKKGEIEGSLRAIVAKAKDAGIVTSFVPKDKLDDMAENGKHQGVLATVPAYDYADLSEVMVKIARNGETPFLIILDKIYDPHNFGAIIRTALACGAHAVIVPKRRSVGITATVVTASAGAVEHMPVCRVANISQTIEALKKSGIWIVGADVTGQSLYGAPLTGPMALVIGNEGEGISRLVKDNCDFLVAIPMPGAMSSLNASVAAAVCMYEIVRRKQ